LKMNRQSLTLLKIVLSALLVYIFGISALLTAGYASNHYLFGALALILSGLFFLAFSKRIRFLYIAGIGILGGICYWGVTWKFDIRLLNESISGFFMWLKSYLTGIIEFNTGYGLIFGALLFVLISGVVVLTERWKWSQISILAGGIFYFGYMWFNYINRARAYGLMFVAVGICRYGLILYENKMKDLERKGYTIEEGAHRGFIITVILISVITFGIANSIKLTIEPVYWEALSEKMVETFPFIVNLKNEFEESRDYGYYNGYENSGGIGHGKRIGEPIKLSDKPVLEVNTNYKKTLYLRGSAYDLYSEKGWYSGAGTEKKYKEDEIIGKNSGGLLNRYEDITLAVKHIGILSSTGFTPFDTYRIKGAKSQIFADERKIIFFSKVLPKKTQYEAFAKIPVMDKSVDRNLFSEGITTKENGEGADSISRGSRLASLKNQLHFTSHNIFDSTGKSLEYEIENSFDQRSSLYDETNSMKYYAIPKGYSEKTRELAQSILKDIKEPVEKSKEKAPGEEDLLKITAIAEYLRAHYEYTLTPPTRPEGVELTEFFLFQSKKGYCVHFATSMAMLLRSVGIPTRYVEGFVSTYNGDEKRIITANRAHAWVEVYLSDLGGWFTFEPTPIIPDIIPSQGIELMPIKVSAVATDENNQLTNRDRNLSVNKNPRHNRVEEEDSSLEKIPWKGKKSFFRVLIKGVCFVAFGMLLLLFFYRIFINYLVPKIKTKQLKTGNTAKALDIYLELLSYYGSFLGTKREKDLTINEFLLALKENIRNIERIKDQEGLIHLLDESNKSFSRARYGGAKLTEEELKLMIKTLAELEYAGVCRFGKITGFRRRLQKS